MKSLIVIALLSAVVVEVYSGASSRVIHSQMSPPRTSRPAALYWTSSTIAAGSTAARATPTTEAALSSSRLAAAARALRGGGSNKGTSGGDDGGEAGSSGQLGASNPRNINLEPASEQTGDDVGVRKGSEGEGTAVEASSGEPGVDDEVSQPAATTVAAKQEPKSDAQEKALREALLSAEGPSR